MQLPILKILKNSKPSEVVARRLEYEPCKPFSPGDDFFHMDPRSQKDYAMAFVLIFSTLLFLTIYFFYAQIGI
jgi:hypothetical protein